MADMLAPGPARAGAPRRLPLRAALLCLVGALGLGAGPAAAQLELFVANNGDATVRVYPALTAINNEPPLRTLSDAQLGSPVGVAVDACADELYVTDAANPWEVRVYPRSGGAGQPALRAISPGAQPDLTQLNEPFGIAVDPGANEIFVANLLGGFGGAPGVTVYNRTDNGNVAPKRSITAFASGPWSLALDLANGELLVATQVLGPGTADAIRVFPKTWAPGTSPVPLRSIAGNNTSLSSPVGVAVDPLRDVIAVANRGTGTGTGTVTIYPRTPLFTNALPLQTLTGLDNPIGVLFDPVTGDLFVTDSSFFGGAFSGRIRVFSRSGPIYLPSRTIAGPATGLAAPMYMALWATPGLAPTSLAAAVLPLSRSVKVGATATAFVAIINTGAVTACRVGIAPAAEIRALFGYQTTSCATNALIGSPNTGATIPPGGIACYVISLTPQEPFGPIDLPFVYQGLNTAPVTALVGVNTLLVSGSGTDVPYVIALADSPSHDGVLRIPGAGGAAAFSVATANVGIGDTITVSADTGSAGLTLAFLICRTDLAVDPAGGCVEPAGPTARVFIGAGGTPTFAIFVSAGGGVVFDPASHRLFVRFTGSDGVVRGATGVAVTTQ